MNDNVFSAKPLCFVIMPFGTKGEAASAIEFDRVYESIVKPAVQDAGMACLRADEEQFGGFIHRAMFERLMVCDYVVADLTQANANVYYELGIRHALRPWSTVLISAAGFRLPFDLAPERVHRYELDAVGCPSRQEVDRVELTKQLRLARAEQRTDSPLFELFTGLTAPKLSKSDLEAFNDRFEISEAVRRQLDEAREAARTDDRRGREEAVEQISRVRRALSDLHGYDESLLIDLLLAYRDFRMWQEMIDLVEDLPPYLARSVTVREQRAFARNRLQPGSIVAENELRELCQEYGSSSETLGLLGRIYKDRWSAAQGTPQARGYLRLAIETYTAGFELDWRDYYPGINAVHLLWIDDRNSKRLAQLLPVVEYAARARIVRGGATYWDYATMIELAIYDGRMPDALDWLDQALGTTPSDMEKESTYTTIRRLRSYCDGDDEYWDALIEGLAPESRGLADQS
ncbi:TRAFs-binding domain-containing protein [Nocardia sp. NPDC056952]|uniref:TRAFs-binding domain-containing protein n=1 Tax=Nocardia sp. NPDC056952 TaxID=3345979 RepID=UPI00363A06AA